MRKKKEDFFFTGLSLCTTDRRLGGMWRDLIRGCFFFLFLFCLLLIYRQAQLSAVMLG